MLKCITKVVFPLLNFHSSSVHAKKRLIFIKNIKIVCLWNQFRRLWKPFMHGWKKCLSRLGINPSIWKLNRVKKEAKPKKIIWKIRKVSFSEPLLDFGLNFDACPLWSIIIISSLCASPALISTLKLSKWKFYGWNLWGRFSYASICFISRKDFAIEFEDFLPPHIPLKLTTNVKTSTTAIKGNMS